MTSAFFSNETASLEKGIEGDNGSEEPFWTPEQIHTDIDACIDWISQHNFVRVCLQFPDHLLKHSVAVASKINEKLGLNVYVMADTTYESCCVDFVTAAHVNADAIIHFGVKCLSESTGELPCLYLGPKSEIDTREFVEMCKCRFEATKTIVVMLDLPYLKAKEAFLNEPDFQEGNYVLWTILSERLMPEGVAIEDCCVVFLGTNPHKLMHFYFMHNLDNLYYFDPVSEEKLVTYKPSNRIISRRNFLIEKVKDSNTVGILVGTLAVKNYIKSIERIKKLLKLHRKKYYVIHVGKPTVAKLANFPEVDVYVVITCPMSEIFESRDFYQPIVTPYDVEMALNGTKIKHFRFDPTCSAFVDREIDENLGESVGDVSLITGKIRYSEPTSINLESKGTVDSENKDKQVTSRLEGIIAENSHFGAGFLAERSWSGLEQNLGKTEVVLALEGTKGIAQQYQNEGN